MGGPVARRRLLDRLRRRPTNHTLKRTAPGTITHPGAARDWGQRLTALASIATVAVAIAALLYTNQANREQERLIEQGQITDRFTKAVEQLGSDKLDIRLGGIYGMERIMRDSGIDESAVIEVLSAYVREHSAPATPSSSSTAESLHLVHPATDVQAALTVLGRRPDPDNWGSGPVDLTGADLTGANLIGADLAGAILIDARLASANFHNANLTNADLTGANIRNANLTQVNMTYAQLANADLTGANMEGAQLAAANVRGANLTGADLAYADLTGANLIEAKMDSTTRLPQGTVVPTPRMPTP